MRLDRRMLPGACSAFASSSCRGRAEGTGPCARAAGRGGRSGGRRSNAVERWVGSINGRARRGGGASAGRGCGEREGRGARSSRWNCASRCARSACACASVGRAFFAPEPAPRTGGRGSARFGAPGPAGFLSFNVVAIGRLDHGQGSPVLSMYRDRTARAAPRGTGPGRARWCCSACRPRRARSASARSRARTARGRARDGSANLRRRAPPAPVP